LYVLHGTLPSKYFAHYLLLVEGISKLLLNSISIADLDAAENYLHLFVSQFQELYGIEFMTYNIHFLQHAASSVRDWGPLWSYSNFMFESSRPNRFLLDLFNGTQGVSVQICRTFAIYRNLPVLASKYLDSGNDSVCPWKAMVIVVAELHDQGFHGRYIERSWQAIITVAFHGLHFPQKIHGKPWSCRSARVTISQNYTEIIRNP